MCRASIFEMVKVKIEFSLVSWKNFRIVNENARCTAKCVYYTFENSFFFFVASQARGPLCSPRQQVQQDRDKYYADDSPQKNDKRKENMWKGEERVP